MTDKRRKIQTCLLPVCLSLLGSSIPGLGDYRYLAVVFVSAILVSVAKTQATIV